MNYNYLMRQNAPSVLRESACFLLKAVSLLKKQTGIMRSPKRKEANYVEDNPVTSDHHYKSLEGCAFGSGIRRKVSSVTGYTKYGGIEIE